MLKFIHSVFSLKFPENRVFGLDILRAFAIMTVLTLHSSYLLPQPIQGYLKALFIDGVTVFFVLSGFLIGKILIKLYLKNKLDAKGLTNFWMRRWLRTLPNYYLILVLVCLMSFLYNKSFEIKDMLSFFYFGQNFYEVPANIPWLNPLNIPLWGESWSLSVEEWFYIFTPIVLVLLSKITERKNAILLTIVFFITASMLIRYYRFSAFPEDNWNLAFRVPVVGRMDSLMYGILGAYISRFKPNLWIRKSKLLLVTGLALILLSKYLFLLKNPFYNDVLFFTVDSIAVLFLLPFLSNLKSGKGILFSTITKISLISYSLYLVNLTLVQGFIIHKIPWSYLQIPNTIALIINNVLFWLLSFAFSILLYKYFELPIMRFRDKKFKG